MVQLVVIINFTKSLSWLGFIEASPQCQALGLLLDSFQDLVSPGGFPNEETEAQTCEIAWQGPHSLDEGELDGEPRTAGLWKEMLGMGGGVQPVALGSDAGSSVRLEERGIKLA